VKSMLSLAAACGLMMATSAWAAEPTPAAAGKAEPASDAERARRATESIQIMRASLRQVTSKAEDARNDKDVVKLNCVNEKMAQMKGLLKVAEQSEAAMKEAMARQDPVASAEAGRITVARSKTDQLQNEAQQCIGQLAYIVDERTTVEVQQPAGQPDRETSGRVQSPAPPAAPVVLRPPSASAFN
jgi:hypothetical protein